MASIVTYSGGLRRIEFTMTPNGPRKMIRLGRVTAKNAEAWKARVEAIIADKLAKRPHDAELSAWLGGLDEKALARLRAVDLAAGVGLASVTLGEFLRRYFDAMTVKDGTRVFYTHTRRNLETHFDETRALRSITEADADGWRSWLVTEQKLSAATVARRIIAARTFWKRAIRWNLAASNPFAGVKAGHQANEARKCYVAPDLIDRIIESTPDREWRVIIALARYGGLRTPSETYRLRWGDIDWARGTIRVTVPKLEHHERLGTRTIPLFPELRSRLLELFAEAPEGSQYVITRNRLGCQNLRQQFLRIIHRAGETAWPKLFHNLRASRESELMREYDLATVCRWIGNSPAVAATHYATSIDLDADFRRAAATGEPEAQQKAQQSPDAGECRGVTEGGAQRENSPETSQNAGFGHALASADKVGEWAILDSNQ